MENAQKGVNSAMAAKTRELACLISTNSCCKHTIFLNIGLIHNLETTRKRSDYALKSAKNSYYCD